jgi:hypothetical protein
MKLLRLLLNRLFQVLWWSCRHVVQLRAVQVLDRSLDVAELWWHNSRLVTTLEAKTDESANTFPHVDPFFFKKNTCTIWKLMLKSVWYYKKVLQFNFFWRPRRFLFAYYWSPLCCTFKKSRYLIKCYNNLLICKQYKYAVSKDAQLVDVQGEGSFGYWDLGSEAQIYQMCNKIGEWTFKSNVIFSKKNLVNKLKGINS